MSKQQEANEVAAKKIPGFVPKARLRRLECDWIEPEEGAESFWAECDVRMTIDEVDELRDFIATKPSYGDLWPRLVDRVKAWNAVALDKATGEYVPVPPPAEIGADAFRAVDPIITDWLSFAIRKAALGGDLKKDKTPSASTPEPASANG